MAESDFEEGIGINLQWSIKASLIPWPTAFYSQFWEEIGMI